MASLATDSSWRAATAFSNAVLPLAVRLMAWSAPVVSLVSTRLTWPLLRTSVALTPLLSAAPLIAAASSSSVVTAPRSTLNVSLPWPILRLPLPRSPSCRPCRASWLLLASCWTKKS